ncbi:MAG: PepSY-associated TM helix domain-containing protein [Planctomycetaceae bacterium]
MHWNKSLYVIHGWLGLNFGLMLFVICLSGTFAVVSHEIDWLLTPAMRATPQASRASYGEMYRNVQQALPGVSIRSAWAPRGSRFACEFWVQGDTGGNRRVYVDPYTGNVLGEGAWFNSQRFFRDFHRRFFLHAWWGIWLVAVFGFVLFAASATGLAFYRRWWAKFFTLRWSHGGRLRWADLHRWLGLWTLLFSLVISATGIWYFAEIPLSERIKSAKLPKLPSSSAQTATGATADEAMTLDDWIGTAQQALPELEVGTIWFPANAKSPIRIEGPATAWLVRDRANKVLIDPNTGDAFFTQRAEQLGPYARWVETADPLHFGDFAGITSKLVWFGLGMMLSLLMPTGAYLWVCRAEQMRTGVSRRLEQTSGALGDAERKCLIRQATHRQMLLGIVTTSIILLMAGNATYEALAKQLAVAGSQEVSLQSVSGSGALWVSGGFLMLLTIAALFWYRCIWLGNRSCRQSVVSS